MILSVPLIYVQRILMDSRSKKAVSFVFLLGFMCVLRLPACPPTNLYPSTKTAKWHDIWARSTTNPPSNGRSTAAGILRLIMLSVAYPMGRLAWTASSLPSADTPYVLEVINPAFWGIIELEL